jgi:hypothetical protein
LLSPYMFGILSRSGVYGVRHLCAPERSGPTMETPGSTSIASVACDGASPSVRQNLECYMSYAIENGRRIVQGHVERRSDSYKLPTEGKPAAWCGYIQAALTNHGFSGSGRPVSFRDRVMTAHGGLWDEMLALSSRILLSRSTQSD